MPRELMRGVPPRADALLAPVRNCFTLIPETTLDLSRNQKK